MITTHFSRPSFFHASVVLQPSAFAGYAGGRRRLGQRAGAPLWRLDAAVPSRGVPWSVFLLGLFLLVLAVIGGFLYIREITSTASSGYDISALERRSEELRAEESRMQLEVAELQSLQRIEERLPNLNLLPTGTITYTSPLLDGALTGQIPVGVARQ